MNDRLFTLLCAIGAFALFYGFFIGDFGGDDAAAVSRPLSTEARPNGYLALRDWLAAAKIPYESLRHRYGWLTSDTGNLQRTGNVLIVTLPGLRPQRSHESADLVDWVRQGNTLVAVAGLFDTPEWGAQPGGVLAELKDMTLLDFKVYEPDKKDTRPASDDDEPTDEADDEPADEQVPVQRPPGFTVDRLPEPKAERMRPRGTHALTTDVESVSAVSEYWSYKFTTASPEQGAVLEVMDDVDTGIAALWAGPLGAGTVVVSGYGSIFTNKMLGRADNARLFSNLIAWRLGAGGVVIFDDMHQGASSFYDPDAFFKDPRLHMTFWWIIGLWLAWAVLSTRLRATRPQITAPREAGFIRSVGQFFARTVPAGAVGERLCEHLFNDIRRRLGWAENGEPVWQWLRSLAVVPAAEVVELERLHGALVAGSKVDLSKLQNLLLSIRKQVL